MCKRNSNKTLHFYFDINAQEYHEINSVYDMVEIYDKNFQICLKLHSLILLVFQLSKSHY